MKAIYRYYIANDLQQVLLNRNTQQAIKILPFLAELSPEWQGVTEKTFNRKDLLQHKAFYRILDKYGKTAPSRAVLDAEKEVWQLQQQGTQEKQDTESELESQIASEGEKIEQESIQEKAADVTPQTKMYQPPQGMYHTETPRKSSKLLIKRFHKDVLQDDWDEEESCRKGMQLYRDSQLKHQAWQEAESTWLKHMDKYYIHMEAKLPAQE